MTRPSLRSQTRTRRTHFQTSRRGSSTTTHPRTTQSYQGRRKEGEGEEHEGEVGGSKVEEGTEGDLSSRLRGVRKRAREDAVGIREDKKDKKAAKASFFFPLQGGQLNWTP